MAFERTLTVCYPARWRQEVPRMLRLFSSLGREVRPFVTVVPGEVRMYVCGVTPYDVTHLGHAFSYVQFDALRRYLIALGYRVRYVQNVTDIDDDMIVVSKREGRSIAEIRDENDRIFRADLDSLNVLRPTAYPFATDHVAEIIEATLRLIRLGYAYEVDGDVFFSVERFPRYGALNAATLAELSARENPEAKKADKRRHPLDFLLWQRTEPGEPSWSSPWGDGRPGWSIECTVMSIGHLGEQIDIHGGGRDLIFPHHENEIAQAEALTGRSPFCRFWLHNGMLRLDGVKMSKSLRNLVLVRDLLSQVPADQLRLYLLSSHYRADPEFRESDLRQAAERLERFRRATVPVEGERWVNAEMLPPPVRNALDDDFDVPRALGALDELATQILAGNASVEDTASLQAALAVLGFAFAGAPGPATGWYEPGPGSPK